jgi:hypothetical protein
MEVKKRLLALPLAALLALAPACAEAKSGKAGSQSAKSAAKAGKGGKGKSRSRGHGAGRRNHSGGMRAAGRRVH